MPPRTPAVAVSSIFNLTSILRALPSSISTTTSPQSLTRCSACLFSTTQTNLSVKKKRRQKRHIDPYRAAQARQRRTANQAISRTLREEREATRGDPIRSQSTPFIQSLRDPSSYQVDPSATRPSPTANQSYINFLLKPTDVAKQLEHSKWLTEPISEDPSESTTHGRQTEALRKQEHESDHQNAARALSSITSLASGSSKDVTRINVQRCIVEFGRHNTDAFLPPKPASADQSGRNFAGANLSESEAAALAELQALPKRVGPDTGSSEVQIAILTTKINTLADNLVKKDKNNKRNLRLLVHRRQKLLNYLRKKERGGSRWQNLVEKLGISDAMWKGEITL